MSFTRMIREIQTSNWPVVRDSLRRHREGRRATTELGDQATPAARHRLRKPWDRIVFEEVVWMLAKEHVICTPAQTAVVNAAKEWAKEYGDLDDPAPCDRALYKAVQDLNYEYDEDEPLTSSAV